MKPSVKEMLQGGKTVRVMMAASLASTKFIEIGATHGGYHAVWLDQEHPAIPHRELEILLLACRAAGLDAFVRLPPNDYATVMRPLEAGAGGILAAQIRTVEEARQVVSWAKYPPAGQRGLYMGAYESNWGLKEIPAHLEEANRDRWVGIQIETREALEAIDEIAAVDGVDHLFVGPSDLSANLGVPGQFMHADMVAALEKISSAVKKAGKSWGALPKTSEQASKCLELGCQLFAIGGDMPIMHLGFKAVGEMFGDIFEAE